MSSDSSDSEDLEYLKEATDNEFLHNSLFNKEKGESEVEILKEKKVLKSLRSSKNEEQQFKLFVITPECRSYVAKQLSSILEKKLGTLTKSVDIHENITPQRTDSIKLFSNSENYIELDQDQPKEQSKSYSRKRDNSALNRRRCIQQPSYEELKQLSVSTEDILSEKEIKYWSNRSKAPIFYYKKDQSGVLVSLD